MRNRLVIIVAAAMLVFGGCGRQSTDDVVARARPPEPTTAPSSMADGVVVDVAGRVRRPGVYRLPAGSRVHEAIEAAGGAMRGADLGVLNRAAVVVDGQQVLVGGSGADVPDTGRGGGGVGAAVSINSADAAALDALPGVGPVTAGRIVAEREANGPFASIDDLARVPGIGPARIESIREVASV